MVNFSAALLMITFFCGSITSWSLLGLLYLTYDGAALAHTILIMLHHMSYLLIKAVAVSNLCYYITNYIEFDHHTMQQNRSMRYNI